MNEHMDTVCVFDEGIMLKHDIKKKVYFTWYYSVNKTHLQINWMFFQISLYFVFLSHHTEDVITASVERKKTIFEVISKSEAKRSEILSDKDVTPQFLR